MAPASLAHFARSRARRHALVSLLAITSPLATFAQSDVTGEKPKSNSAADEKVVELDKFEVVGSFSGSLAAAAEAKQAAPVITEVIAAEDIGKLPDASIADSLTRLTGLTTQRTNGRSQAINIRGLTGDFSTGMLNGREQVSTGENRAVEFDQYPAELLSKVIVYKTAEANLTGQGLAGTIDLQTVRPLSHSHRSLAANGYYEWTQYKQLTPGARAKGERFNISYIDQFDGGKLGVAIGFAHSAKPFEGKQFQSWGYPTDSSNNFVLGGTKSYVRTSDLDRDGLMGVIEYKPNDNIHSVVDIYISHFEEKQLLRGMEIPLYWSGAVYVPGTAADGLETTSTFSNVQPVVRNDVFKRKDTPFALGWNLQIGEKTEWPIVFDAGYSRVSRDDINLETYSGLGFRGVATNPDQMSVKLIPGQIPVIKSSLNYADGSVLKLTDPQGWGPATLPGGGMYGYVKYFRAKDELGQLKLSTEHELPKVFKSVEVGASFTDRFKRDGEGPTGFLDSPNGQVTLPLPARAGTTDMSFLGLGNIYAYDPLAAYGAGVWGFSPNSDTGVVANRFKITEKITQVYTQFNIKTKIGGLPLSGDLGIRAIRSDQESDGFSAQGSVLNPARDEDKYTNVAPDLNLTLEAAENTLVRFSVARQLARPRMYDMRVSRTWSFDATKAASSNLGSSPWSGSGGNTKLRPWQADAIDLSLEKYFSENRGYISLAGFYKNLKSYIYVQNSVADFSGYPTPAGVTPVLFQGIVSQPVNGSGGSIRGIEATVSLSSELINRNLHGFGLIMGGAYTDSSIKPWGPGNGDAPIAGLARKVANITLYYERHGFAIRLSERYRSSTREYITTFGPPNRGGDASPGSGFTVAQPERVIDGQLSYTFRQTRAKGLTIYFQAYNLNDEPLITYNNGDARQVMNYQKYGASFSLGAAYSF